MQTRGVAALPRLLAWLPAAAAGAALLAPGLAWSAFPGTNGPIVFQSTREATAPGCGSTSSELFVTPPSVGSATQLTCTGFTDQHPSASPDGTEVVFSSNRGTGGSEYQLYTVPLSTSGGAVTAPTDVSFPQNAGSDDYPSWAPASPEGQGTVIFQRTLPGQDPQLYTENVNDPSSPAVAVFSTPTGFSDTEPVFDPSNANEIAFVRQAPGGPQQVYLYDLATPSTPPVDLSAADGDGSANDSKPDFAPAPTGDPAMQDIALQSDRVTSAGCPGTQLYLTTDRPGAPVMPVFQSWSGGEPTGVQICPTVDGSPVDAENPVFSPDGTEIAYDQAGAESEDVYAYEAPFELNAAKLGQAVDLTPDFATDEAPTWAPVAPGESTPEVPRLMELPAAAAVAGCGALVPPWLRRRRAAGARGLHGVAR